MYMAGVVLTAIAISSCDETTGELGSSLTSDNDNLDIQDAVFYATSKTYAVDSVLSLSSSCYFGKVKDPETNTEVKSEFTSQFHLLEYTYISPEEMIVSRDGDRAGADSCVLTLYISTGFNTADSLNAIKMRVKELARPLEETTTYYSNFDLKGKGYIKTDGINQGHIFTHKDLSITDSALSASTYLNNIHIKLSQPYRVNNGSETVVYNNYGSYLMQNYYDHPEYFRNSYTFIHNLCPGFYFELEDGYGFHSKITNIGLNIYYRVQKDTTVNNAILTLAGTKEVLQTNHVYNDHSAISQLANETTHTYLKTPSGLFTEVTLPVDDIKKNHENDSLLAAKIVFQRLNDLTFDTRMLPTPSTILMIQEDSLKNYFETNQVPDNITSFYTTLTSKTNTYTFSNISNLISFLWKKKEENLRENSNWVNEHPNWNKVLLIPITYTVTSSSSMPTRVEHDMSLSSTKLVGGPDNPNAPIAISVVYGKFQ